MTVPRLESKESVPGPFQTFKCFTIEIGSDVSALTPKECEKLYFDLKSIKQVSFEFNICFE